MKTTEINGVTYKLSPLKKEEKTELLFILTMPNVGSWNGNWSGERQIYARTRKGILRGKKLYPNLNEGGYYYNFGDGWGAHVRVSYVTPGESKSTMKKSQGFLGYEWMIDSILANGEIRYSK